MPTYEYQCTKCKYQFERFQSMRDEPVKRCPKCRCKVNRLIGTGSGIIFKGSGFYETDYRSSGYKAEKTKAEKPVESSGSAATEKKVKKEKKSETVGKE